MECQKTKGLSGCQEVILGVYLWSFHIRCAPGIGSRDLVCGGGTHHPATLYLSWFNTHPPSPASSYHHCFLCFAIFCPFAAASCQPLSLPSELWVHRRSVFIGVVAEGSHVSASNHWVPDSALALWSSGSTMAPISLTSTVACQFTCFAELPHLSVFALVSHQPSTALGHLVHLCRLYYPHLPVYLSSCLFSVCLLDLKCLALCVATCPVWILPLWIIKACLCLESCLRVRSSTQPRDTNKDREELINYYRN